MQNHQTSYFAVTLYILGAQDDELELRAMGAVPARLLGMTAIQFQAAEDTNDTARLETAFEQIDTATSFNFIIKVSFNSFTETFEATAVKITG